MTATRDKFGRPIVVVTGMGVVTSLGAGKQDNWKKLTAGQSGIKKITRFATDALKTTMAGSVDFVPVEPFCSSELTERMAHIVAEEAITEAKIGSKGSFPGPLFLAVAPVEIEWLHREMLAAESRSNDSIGYDDLLRATASGRFAAIHERCVFGSVAEHLADRFGTRSVFIASMGIFVLGSILCAAAPNLSMLLVAGDWWRLAESDDLAVIVPELDKALGHNVAVLVASREAEIRFRADLRSFGTREKELLERAKALISAWPQDKAVNEARVLANQWDALHERFAACQLSASSDSARLHELLLRYTDLRRRAYRALVDLPREAAPAEFERLAHEIKQTVDEINSLSSRRG